MVVPGSLNLPVYQLMNIQDLLVMIHWRYKVGENGVPKPGYCRVKCGAFVLVNSSCRRCVIPECRQTSGTLEQSETIESSEISETPEKSGILEKSEKCQPPLTAGMGITMVFLDGSFTLEVSYQNTCHPWPDPRSHSGHSHSQQVQLRYGFLLNHLLKLCIDFFLGEAPYGTTIRFG